MGILDFAVGILLTSVVLCAFYLVLIRPQRRRLQELREMAARLSPGDQIVTAGGLVGTVVGNADVNTVLVEVAKDIRVRVRRNLINDIILKGREQRGSS